MPQGLASGKQDPGVYDASSGHFKHPSPLSDNTVFNNNHEMDSNNIRKRNSENFLLLRFVYEIMPVQKEKKKERKEKEGKCYGEK